MPTSLALSLAFAALVAPSEADRLDPLPPGWAVRFTSRASPNSTTADVTTHAEHAAFTLESGESPHPEVAADGFEATYEGDLKISKAGKYRFAIDVDGGSGSIHVDALGVDVRSGNRPVDRPGASLADTPSIELKPGNARLVVTFRRDGAKPVRLRTSWEMASDGNGGGFACEPIPSRVVSVPKERSGLVQRELAARRGRVLLTELGCVSCHAGAVGTNAPTSTVDHRGAISLATIADRVGGAWLENWIASPQKTKPGCGMPTLFRLGGADAAKEQADLEALVAMLESLAPANSREPAKTDSTKQDAAVEAALVARGRELYHEVGCVACHGAFESPAALFGDESTPNQTPQFDAPVPFVGLEKKWRVDELAKFLRDPRAIRTHGRMPSFGFDDGESSAVAYYLSTRFEPAPPRVASKSAGAVAPPDSPVATDAAKVEHGKLVFETRGCAQCHTLGEGVASTESSASSRSSPSSDANFAAPPLAKLDATRGCLAGDAASRGRAPRYELDETTRAQLRAGLDSVRRASGAAAPIDATQRALAAFHCSACHERDGVKVADVLQPYFKSKVDVDLGDEGRLAPRLDGVGLRLQSPWLEKVVSEGARARPYLWTRMPSFGADVAASFAHGLAAIEGEWRSDAARMGSEPAASAADLATLGRRLAGSGGMNCVTCHSFGARPSAGTPGLDFQFFARRIRREWWQRYALSPLRFKPGTRMPSFYEDGKSQVTAILDGDATRQIEALWSWFEKADQMPAPEGVPSGQRMVLDVGDRPKVFRTFLARAGNRGIAVGFPAGLHFAFDAEQIRLCEAWRGEFLDVAPVWNGRGGNVAPQLGPTVWSAPAGPLLLLAPKDDPFALATWPTDSGRNHGLKFLGYRLAADGSPTFLYQLRDAATSNASPPQPGSVEVEERFQPDARDAQLFRRLLRVTNVDGGRRVCLQSDPKSKVSREVGGRVERQTAGDGRVVSVVVPASGSTTVEFEIWIAP